MDLETLVEKITREVMENVRQGQNTGVSTAVTAPSSSSGSTDSTGALLLAGSENLPPAVIEGAVSFLKKNNFKVTAALNSDSRASLGGSPCIRCSSLSDCASALRNHGLVVLLLPDLATISKMANLIADRFDIEGVLRALESGIQVWGLMPSLCSNKAIQNKVCTLLKEIESYGIRICDLPDVSVISTPSSPGSASVCGYTTSACPMLSSGDCVGCGLCANLNTDSVKSLMSQGAERVSASPGISTVSSDLAGMIDHTLLKPDATKEQVLKVCEEAKQYSFASVCINPTWVPLVAQSLKGSPVKTCVVIGFPLGANSTMIKAMETRDCVASGADEVDMVINVGALKAGDYELVRKDIESVVEAAQGRIVKVILETALLTDEEKVKACQLAKQAGADFVKTSTGFGPGGATAEDIALMRKTVGKYMGVKASGGIRDLAKAQEMINAGATRIGASASVGIVKGAAAKPGGGY